MDLFFTVDVLPDITATIVERCVSNLSVTWNTNTQCAPMNYAVMLTDTSGRSMEYYTSDTSYSFPGLTSDTEYTITVNGTNRFGPGVDMISNSTLKSNGKIFPILILILCNVYLYI